MSSTSKNQPTFQINQVGNFNAGDLTIQGNQIGIQHNYAPEQDLAEAAQKIQALLTQLDQTYPTATKPQQQTFIEKFLELIEATPDLIKILLVGGVEWLKALWPLAGVPIAMADSLYEAVRKRHS